MVLMAMKLLTFHNKCVADFPAYEKDDDFFSFNIVQYAQVACSQFELGEGIGTQAFDCLRWHGWLILQACQDGGFQSPLFASGQGFELPVCILGNRDSVGQGAPLAAKDLSKSEKRANPSKWLLQATALISNACLGSLTPGTPP